MPTTAERVSNAIGYGVLTFIGMLVAEFVCWPLLIWVWCGYALFQGDDLSPASVWLSVLTAPVVVAVIAAHRGWRVGVPNVWHQRRWRRLTTRTASPAPPSR